MNTSLGEPPESQPLDEEQYSAKNTEEGIYIEFNIPEDTWQTRVYIDGLGEIAQEVVLIDSKYNASFFYPFVQAGKEYTIRFVFLRDEDKDENQFVIDYKDGDGTVGWFQTKVTAGYESKGEVRFTSKGSVSVNKKGDFRFTQKPTFTNEHLLLEKWAVDIGLVEGISWEHGAERKTKWHSIGTPIPCTELTKPINLYDYREQHKSDLEDWDTESEISIDFICVRPVASREYDGKTYNYMWESFAQDIYYPPLEPEFLHGIYLEFDVPKSEFSRCDVIIDEIGKVAEEVCVDKNKASFFYPFVEPGKEYTIRFSFKKLEPEDSEGFVIPTHGSDTISELTKTVTVGPRAKGEVWLLTKGGLEVDPECKITYFQRPTFENEHLLDNRWMIEMGLVEGISWEHGDERRTKWHCAVRVSNNHPVEHCNLRDLPFEYEFCEDHSVHKIDFVCVRPILRNYKYNGKEYNYMWDGYTSDVNYPPRS